MLRRLPLIVSLLVVTWAATVAFAIPLFHTGPDPSKTGAPEVAGVPAEESCASCHYVFGQDNLNQPGGDVRILDLPASYVPGQTYTLRVQLACDSTAADLMRHWGFQATAVRASDGLGAGTFIVRDPDSLQIVTAFASDPWASRAYVEHRETSIYEGAPSPVEWSFDWRAPDASEGKIYFFAAGNATNGNYDTDGDWVYTKSDSLADATTPTLVSTWGAVKGKYRR